MARKADSMFLASVKTADDAVQAGFAQFNGWDHLCVNVPDGGFTITAKTSEGHKITFAFCPYKKGGPPQCVDVQREDSEEVIMNGDDALPVQQVICFGRGKDKFRSELTTDETKAVTLTTVLLHDARKPSV